MGKKITEKNVRYRYTVSEIENNDIKDKQMDNVEKIQQIENIIEKPSKKVKVEKKEKGLYERAENKTVVVTEDNKLLLND